MPQNTSKQNLNEVLSIKVTTLFSFLIAFPRPQQIFSPRQVSPLRFLRIKNHSQPWLLIFLRIKIKLKTFDPPEKARTSEKMQNEIESALSGYKSWSA